MIRSGLLQARRYLGWAIKPKPIMGGRAALFRGFGEAEEIIVMAESGENRKDEEKGERKGWDERSREKRLVQEVRRISEGLEMNDSNRLRVINSPEWEKTVEALRDNLMDYDELSEPGLTRLAFDSTVAEKVRLQRTRDVPEEKGYHFPDRIVLGKG